jgi:hypothetical protein
MEYRVITQDDSEYPQKLIERLDNNCPEKIYGEVFAVFVVGPS